jgi:hypothetical protein
MDKREEEQDLQANHRDETDTEHKGDVNKKE